MNLSLAQFQDRFVDALYGVESPGITALTRQPGFSVHRNTVLKGATDALLANFPTIKRLVGIDWFMAAAAIHARLSPPTDGRLINYGAGFPSFLDGFEHAREMPYLGDVARLDLLWTAVHCADDEPVIDLSAIAKLSPSELGCTRLKTSATVRWIWFAQQPAYTIWRINREQVCLQGELDWRGEGALLTRRAGRVFWQAASAAECAFLDACAADLTLDLATDKALEIQPTLDLSELIAHLVTASAFVTAEQS